MSENSKHHVASLYVIGFFLNRKGFDDWWNGIDEETQNEIGRELQEGLEKIYGD